MAAVKQVYLLLICQGFYLGSVCQRWDFPSTIPALIGSCVEIPCTYDLPRISGTSSPVWYLYIKNSTDPEILNTKDSSSVIEEYKARTSLVPGIHSCTLRIDPVRREDTGRYYPGIAEDKDINAFQKQSKDVDLSVTDKMNIRIYWNEPVNEGKATIIRCTAEHTCGSSPPSLQWNKLGQVKKQSVMFSLRFWIEESELTYIPSYVDDGTPVQCTATYHNGQKMQTSRTLDINYSPKNVTVTIIRMDQVMEGSDVTLQCNSFSKTMINKYEWYKGKDKTQLPDRGRQITVRKVTRDTEPYSCAAINAVGRGESALTELPVPYAAIGVHVTVKKEREFTTLICDFLSSRPDVTHYTWMKDGSILPNETGKTLTVCNNEENYQLYSCIAHNRAGNSSSTGIYDKDEESSNSITNRYTYVILLATVGAISLLLLVLLLYACWRKRHRKRTSARTEDTYTDLRTSDITTIYNQLQLVVASDKTVVRSDEDAAHYYENI